MGIITTSVNDSEAHEEKHPLLTSISDSSDVDYNSCEQQFSAHERTGTVWSATAHIITGVIGAGVLSLAWSTAQLGWIAAPLSIIIFALITQFSAFLLSDCYRSPLQFGAITTPSLSEAVRFYLGEKRHRICVMLVLEGLYGSGVAYTITATQSVRAIQRSNCYHREGQHANCGGQDNSSFILMFGLVQIVMSQIPNLHNLAWVSVIAAVMSFCYAFIGLGLGVAKVIENGKFLGSISGVSTNTLAEKLWLVFQGLGDIAFAYPYAVILLEIQDTLRPPKTEIESQMKTETESQTMKKASTGSIIITTFFYLACGSFGYAAFGDKTPGNLLTGFGFYEPYWLVDFANACIILHLVGGYQVYSQPTFALGEKWFNAKFPNSASANNVDVKLPFLPAFQLNIFRLWFRTMYVGSITGVAMLFPYFNQVLGLLGALNFWSLGIYFPVEMYIARRNIGAWTTKWILLEGFSFICLLISIVGLIGSIQGLISVKLS